MKKKNELSEIHPDFETTYDKLVDKTSRNEKTQSTRDLFDKLCDRTSKQVIEEFFKDYCCRYLFRRLWQSMYDQKYKPCPKRENTKKPAKERKVKRDVNEEDKSVEKFQEYQHALLFYREYCELFEEVLALPEYKHCINDQY